MPLPNPFAKPPPKGVPPEQEGGLLPGDQPKPPNYQGSGEAVGAPPDLASRARKLFH